MSTQSEPLRLMLGAVIAMREAGYTQEDVQEMAGEAWGYEGGGQPYAFGNCSNCGRMIIGWTGYQWSILICEPCSRCGQPW